jgi:hypothetical protein
MDNKVRIIAFYLPQFHPIPENDEWWGKGFTEWTNVAKAKPLFKGHYQPRLPADLGFYDLRVPETRKLQAEMAREYGIEGFAYWHYWFSGKRILERPFNEILKSGEPDFPFCLAWANESWSGIWHGLSDKILIKQEYPGQEDYTNHFYSILDALKDPRYIKIEGKPVFYVLNPYKIPDCKDFIALWNKLAQENGLDGIYFIAPAFYPEQESQELNDYGFNAINSYRLKEAFSKMRQRTIIERIHRKLTRAIKLNNKVNFEVYDYKEFIKNFVTNGDQNPLFFPTIYPSWDNSPRSGTRALIIESSTPETFKIHVRSVLINTKDKPFDKRVIFLKSWNEWAEGNYVEPDSKYGLEYLKSLKSEIEDLDFLPT